MCLRFALSAADKNILKLRFHLEKVNYESRPRTNIAPTQTVPVIYNDDSDTLSVAKWGVPVHWSSRSGSKLMFNARAEGVDTKPMFKKDFAQRRCLMIADAFYEWRKPDKQPFRISLKDNQLFAFAGFYHEKDERTCCMITCGPNDFIAKIHNRMPVILPIGMEKKYLEADLEEAVTMLKPFPQELMQAEEISSRINTSRKDSSDLVRPPEKKVTLEDFM